MNDYEQYDIEFVSGSVDCPSYMRARWNRDGGITAFEWWRNVRTMDGICWRRYDIASVTVDGAAVGREYFAPSAGGTRVRCSGATVRPWGRDELEIQGVATRHIAQVPA